MLFRSPSPEQADPRRQRFEQLLDKAATGEVTAQELDLMKILQTNLQNKAITAPSAATSNNVIGINMSNILAFAHVPPGEDDQFNKDTDNLWPEAAKLKPAQAKALFKL